MTRKNRNVICVKRPTHLLTVCACLAASPGLAATYHYTALAAPGAQQTLVTGLNTAGTVVGNWIDTNQHAHGYVWQNGQFATIDPPGTVLTLVNGINDAGTIVGQYQTADAVSHGFIYSAGQFTTVDAPGADYTALVSINGNNQITGEMQTKKTASDFLYEAGKFTTIIAKGIPFPVALNAAGKVVGYYNKKLEQLGYSYQDGKLSRIAIPNSSLTNPDGVNSAGVVVGYYYDTTTSSVRGFIYAKHKATVLDTPGQARPGQARTFIYNVNDNGLVIGNAWTDTPAHAESFVLDHGSSTAIQPPGGSGIYPAHINTAGMIAGSYKGPAGNEVFLATP